MEMFTAGLFLDIFAPSALVPINCEYRGNIKKYTFLFAKYPGINIAYFTIHNNPEQSYGSRLLRRPPHECSQHWVIVFQHQIVPKCSASL